MIKRNLAELETEIAKTKEELTQVRGSETEVYARIVGYYRSVRNWNKGKREEYGQRKLFAEKTLPEVYKLDTSDTRCDCAAVPTYGAENLQPARYELFARATCPNCPPVKEYLSTVTVPGQVVDVDSAEGLDKAGELGIFAAPTVIIYDSRNAEIARAYNLQELSAIFQRTAVLC